MDAQEFTESRGTGRIRVRLSGLTWVLCIGAGLLISGCGLAGLGQSIEDAATRAVSVLDDAIETLANESADWQQVLQDAMSQLTDDAQSTIRNEIADVASRSIAQAGVEFRCDVDFIRARVREALIDIRASLLGQIAEPVEPSLCSVVPLVVDRTLVPDRLKTIEFYGYNLDFVESLRVFLEDGAGRLTDVTEFLDRPTHYVMTLRFGANGVLLDSSSRRFVLEWDGRQISSIGVIQAQTPVCRTDLDEFPVRNNEITLQPDRIEGDGDFNGHGPHVQTWVKLDTRPDLITATVYMYARETKSDWTTVEGSETRELYRPPAGWRVERVIGMRSAEHSFTDGDHDLDRFGLGSGLLAELFYVGDTSGDEAGTATEVTAIFNKVQVEIVENSGCVAPGTALQAYELGAISEEARAIVLSHARVSDLRPIVEALELSDDVLSP